MANTTAATAAPVVFNSSKKKKFAEEKTFQSNVLLGGLDGVKDVLRNKCYKHSEVRTTSAADKEHGAAEAPVPSDAPFPGDRTFDEFLAKWKDEHLDCGCTKASHILDLLAFKVFDATEMHILRPCYLKHSHFQDPAQGSNRLPASATAFRYGNVNQCEAYLRLLLDVTHCRLDMMLAPELQRTFQVILESLSWVDAQIEGGVVTEVEVDEMAPDLQDAVDQVIRDVFAIYRRIGGDNIENHRD
jgi:hypothetical protein